MLENGLIVTLIGMGVVFSFLCLLIVAMMVNAKVMKLVSKIFPEEVQEPAKVKVPVQDDTAVAIAIAACKMLKK